MPKQAQLYKEVALVDIPRDIPVYHAKGFDNLNERNKKDHSQAVGKHLAQQVTSKKVCLVYDGDGLHENQWTVYLVQFAKHLQEKGVELYILTCREIGGWGSKKRMEYIHEFIEHFQLEKPYNLCVYTYGEKAIENKLVINDKSPSSYEEVGMYLLHLTSNHFDGKICIHTYGGGITPGNEFYYTKGQLDTEVNRTRDAGKALSPPKMNKPFEKFVWSPIGLEEVQWRYTKNGIERTFFIDPAIQMEVNWISFDE